MSKCMYDFAYMRTSGLARALLRGGRVVGLNFLFNVNVVKCLLVVWDSGIYKKGNLFVVVGITTNVYKKKLFKIMKNYKQ